MAGGATALAALMSLRVKKRAATGIVRVPVGREKAK